MTCIRKITTLFLALFLLGTLMFPVLATTVEHDGLEISVVMDKETYESGEPITATITVTNVTGQPITVVNLEQLIPEGYKLAEDSEAGMRDVTVQPGRILVMQVTFEGDPSAPAETEGLTGPAAFLNTLLYGKTANIPNMFLAVMAVLAVLLFLFLT